MICGKNGSGKTWILDALAGALEGNEKGAPGRDHLSMLFVRDISQSHVFTYEGMPGGSDVMQDFPEALWVRPGESYRFEDAEAIYQLFAEAENTDLLCLVPSRDGSTGWFAYRGVAFGEGECTDVLRRRDNAYIRAARLTLTGQQEAFRQVCDQWGFDPTSDFLSGVDFLYTTQVQDELLMSLQDEYSIEELPDDGMPVPVISSLQEQSAYRDKPRVDVRLIRELAGVTQLREVIAQAIARAKRGFFQTQKGWVTWEELQSQVDQGLTEAFADEVQSTQLWVTIRRLALERGFAGWLDQVTQRANAYLSMLMLDAPVLHLRLPETAQDVFAGRGIDWVSVDGLPLDSLSRAELRWATLSLQLALESTVRVSHEPSNVFVLIDEPEAALHRRAEAHMARGLTRLSSEPGMSVVVASHSADVLDFSHARIFKAVLRPHLCVVSSDEEMLEWRAQERSCTVLQEITALDRQNLHDLGLNTSDLLPLYQAIILVEGAHEEQILDHFIGSELANLRIWVLPYRGVAKLPATLDSRILADHTDAILITVTDNLTRERVKTTWDRALQIDGLEGHAAARSHIQRQLPTRNRGGTSETEQYAEFMIAALRHGARDRLEPYATQDPDILFYLPISQFTDSGVTWAQLKRDHARHKAQNRNTPNDWKKWATSTYKFEISESTIQRALDSMDEAPSEVLALLDHCRLIVRRRQEDGA